MLLCLDLPSMFLCFHLESQWILPMRSHDRKCTLRHFLWWRCVRIVLVSNTELCYPIDEGFCPIFVFVNGICNEFLIRVA